MTSSATIVGQLIRGCAQIEQNPDALRRQTAVKSFGTLGKPHHDPLASSGQGPHRLGMDRCRQPKHTCKTVRRNLVQKRQQRVW
jgi:hypothetical protein